MHQIIQDVQHMLSAFRPAFGIFGSGIGSILLALLSLKLVKDVLQAFFINRVGIKGLLGGWVDQSRAAIFFTFRLIRFITVTLILSTLFGRIFRLKLASKALDDLI